MAAPTALAVPGRRGVAGWAESRIVLVLGLSLTLLMVVAALAGGWLEYRNAIDRARVDQALKARVLENHATLSINTAAVALSALAERIVARQPAGPTELNELLREALAGVPAIRGFTLVGPGGAVLASSLATDRQSAPIRLAPLGPWPAPELDRLGGYLPGRGLADLSGPTGSDQASSKAPAGVGFVPLVRTVRLQRAGNGGQALLVALLNPDAFSTYQTLTLADPRSAAALLRYDGAVLAATAGAGVLPGARVATFDDWRDRLAEREHDAYLGPAIGGGSATQVAAFRVSRQWPLAVVVETPHAVVLDDWWTSVQAVFWTFGAAVVLLPSMTVVASRGLLARERTRDLLNRAQAEVVRRERELSVTLRSVQELIFRTDPKGVLTYVNARWKTIGGGSPRDAIGRELAALATPENRETVQALFAGSGDAGVRTAQVLVQPDADAQARVFDVAVVALTQDGEVTGFAGSAVDVTERVTAQRKLQTQLEITALVLETSPLPLSVRDLQGRYLSVNQAWEAFTGIRRQDVLGAPPAGHAPTPELDRVCARGDGLLARGGRARCEARLTHADGQARDVVLEQVLMPGDNGAPAGILTVLMDVSEFRAAERATREARDAAEEASRAKSEFIANISHELRTPLQSILGFSELGAARGADRPRLAAMFEDIHASGKRMLALVNDLLDVAKIESAVGTFHLERADLRPLVREVVREFDPLLAEKGLQIALALSAVPQTAKVDPLRFQQVVRNILANAVRFSPPQGRIVVESRTTAQAEIALRIADEGPGIPPAEIDHIFDAFVQSSTTKDGSGGTGLGLTISRKILEIHGGRIAAANRPGGGAEFTVWLPARGALETMPAPL